MLGKRKRLDNELEQIDVTTLNISSINTSSLNVSTSGTAAAPSINWGSNTGFYNTGSGIGVSVGGTLKSTIGSSGITNTVPVNVGNGTVTAPSLSFTNSTSTGLYSEASNTLDVTAGGTKTLKFTTAATTSTVPVLFTQVTDSSSTTTGSLICSGGVGIAKSLYVGTGIFLPTTGGTPSALNYYEEYTHTSQMTGIWASAQNLTLSIVRMSKLVRIIVYSTVATANTASFITVTTPLPSRFYPVSDVYGVVFNTNNGATSFGTMWIDTSGNIKIYCTNSSGAPLSNFVGSGNGGTLGGSVSYFTS